MDFEMRPLKLRLVGPYVVVSMIRRLWAARMLWMLLCKVVNDSTSFVLVCGTTFLCLYLELAVLWTCLWQ